MTLCDDIRAQLPLFVGGDLEAPLAVRVAEHLSGAACLAGRGREEILDPPVGAEGCADCRSVFEELRRVRGVLLELAKLSPAPAIDVWEGVRSALASEGRVGAPRWVPLAARKRVGRLHLLQRLASAAAAVALLAGGWHLVQRATPLPQAQQPGPTAGQDPGQGVRLAEQGDQAPGEVFLPAAAGGGLRRLEPGEVPLSNEALPFLDGMRGGPVGPYQPALRGRSIDPSHPTLANDRLLR